MVKDETNNLHFYTDIYPIFPQVLFYHVRVFDVCGALQYFNVLSPPPPPSPLPPPPMSDVWGIATMLWQPGPGTSPRI